MDFRLLLFGLVAATVWMFTLAVVAAYAFRRLESRERLKAIEHGLDLVFDPRAAADGSRRAGVALVSLAIGVALADLILVIVSREPEAFVFMALAVLPGAVGVGLIIDSRVAVKEPSR